MWKGILAAVAVVILTSFLVVEAVKNNQDWVEQQRRIGFEVCAEKWSPREVELTERSMCRVKIDGKWWPEDAVKVAE